MKVSKAIGISSKLRYNSNPDVLKNISLYSVSHLLYIWYIYHISGGQKNLSSLNQIQILRNRALRIINFKKSHDSTNKYSSLRI